jgi:hypothetical protein
MLDAPYQNQDGANWCGPASLAMLVNCHGYNTHFWEIAAGLSMGHDSGIWPITRDNLQNVVNTVFPELAGKTEIVEWNACFDPFDDLVRYLEPIRITRNNET